MSSKKDASNAPNPFTLEEGTVNLGGIDTLVRLTLDQSRADERRGLKTGMFISGYRGSPVGMLDAAFIKNQKTLLSRNIHFVDGLNEDLAATAVWGTQMLHTVGKQKFDGVTGLWYGKAPGVDRSRRRAQARQLHRHRQERRRARGGRRRPELQELVAVQPVRADADACRYPIAVPGQRAGDPRSRPARLHDVAPVRPLGRPEDRHQRGRRQRHGQRRSEAAELHHARPDVRRQGLRADHEPGHERARRSAGDGAVALHAPARSGQALRRRQQTQQRRVREPRRMAGHHHRGQNLQRLAPVFPGTGPGRRGAAPLRHPHPEDGHAVPDGAGHRARLREGSGRDLCHRGKAPLPRDVREERALRHSQCAAHRRQVRRRGEGAAAALRRVRVRRHRPRLDQTPVAEGAHRVGRGLAGAAGRDPRCAPSCRPRRVPRGTARAARTTARPRRSTAASSPPASAATRWRCGWAATW